jgi:hypothetical protein
MLLYFSSGLMYCPGVLFIFGNFALQPEDAAVGATGKKTAMIVSF